MMPIGPLMIEHRLIERMIKLMEIEMLNIEKDSGPDTDFIEKACDFLKTYADRCHHGKEEDILFKKLKDKNLSAEHKEILNSLMEDHKLARKTTSELAAVNRDQKDGTKDRVNEIHGNLKLLTDLYPEHIRKEDKVFFIPSMTYFTDEEKDEMLKSFNEFDRNLVHEKYKSLVTDYEKTDSAEVVLSKSEFKKKVFKVQKFTVAGIHGEDRLFIGSGIDNDWLYTYHNATD